MEAFTLKLAREIRMAISNGVTEEYTAQQIREAINPLVDALRFYQRREHWMALTDAPDAPQTNLVAHGKHMTTGNGYDEADAALAKVK